MEFLILDFEGYSNIYTIVQLINYKSFCYYSITYADVIFILLTKKSKQTQFSNVSNNTNIKALDIVKGSDVNTFTVVCHELVTFLKS